MPIYQCAAPVGLLIRDMKARIATAISGEIVVPFVAGEVNLVMQPGLSGRAAVTVISRAEWRSRIHRTTGRQP